MGQGRNRKKSKLLCRELEKSTRERKTPLNQRERKEGIPSLAGGRKHREKEKRDLILLGKTRDSERSRINTSGRS